MRVFVTVSLAVVLGCSLPTRSRAAEENAEDLPVPIDDDRVRTAYELRLTIEEQELALAKQLEELFRATESASECVDVDSLENVQPTLDGLAEIAQRLEGMGEPLSREYGRYEKSLASYRQTLQSGPEVYLAAADAAREWAKAEEEPQVYKEEYVRLAEAWEGIASCLTERDVALQTQDAELRETLQFVEATIRFLGRFRQHVLIFPDLDSVSDHQHLIDNLKTFVQNVEKFRGIFHRLHSDLTSNTNSAAVRRDGNGHSLAKQSVVGDDEPSSGQTRNLDGHTVQAALLGSNSGAVVLLVLASTLATVWRCRRRRMAHRSPGETANDEDGQDTSKLTVRDTYFGWAVFGDRSAYDMDVGRTLNFYRPSGALGGQLRIAEWQGDDLCVVEQVTGDPICSLDSIFPRRRVA